MRTVLVTGAAGTLGSAFTRAVASSYRLRLTDLPGAGLQELAGHGSVVEADLTDLEAAKDLCRGMDTVVHLAADPDPSATWSSLLPANIVATYNTMTAAVAAGCRRVVYASSIHAVTGYPPDVQVKTSDPVNPGDLYGVTKCFGEALGRYVAEQEGVSVIAVRIGMAQPPDVLRPPEAAGLLDVFLSERDLVQLLQRCVDVELEGYAVVHGLSDNRFKRLDLTDTRQLLGYAPQDDGAALNEGLTRELLKRPELDTSEQASGLRDDRG
jgi:NAD(P)-dependent dehydrogenase (short-subunit alcohol dehydrogenase family)